MKFRQPRVKLFLDRSSYGRHDAKQPWCCNCQVVNLDGRAARRRAARSIRKLVSQRSPRWWRHDGLDERFGQPCANSFLHRSNSGNAWCKNDAVLQLWFCNCHVARLEVLKSNKMSVSMMKSWWLDETFGQPCAKVISWLIQLCKALCKTNIVFATLSLQLSSPQLGHTNPTNTSWVLISKKKAFRWWSHDRLDEVRTAVCQVISSWIKLWKSTMQHRRCVATPMLQMSRCQVGRANPMKNILSIDFE